MKLGPKLFGPPIVLVAVLSAAGITQLLFTRREEAALVREVDRLEHVLATSQQLQQVVGDAERDVALLSGRAVPEVVMARLARRQEELNRLVEKLRRFELSGTERRLAKDVSKASHILSEARSALTAADSRASASAAVRWSFAARRVSGAGADLSAGSLDRLSRSFRELTRLRVLFGRTVLLLTVGAGLFAALFAAYVLRGLLRPLAHLTTAVRKVGQSGAFALPFFEPRDDELGALASSFQEMTRRLSETHQNLEQALKAREEFLSVAAHELKTPLTSLALQLSILRNALTAPSERQTKSLDGIERQCRRVGRLVDELLDVSRLQAGKLSIQPEELALRSVVEDAVARCQELLERSRNRVSVNVPEEVKVFADPSRLDQILVNLLSNAAKYAPGSAVRIAARQEGGDAVLDVEDGGAGIAPEVRARLFQPYVRANPSGGGLGLGLYICQQVIAAHGGTISVTSLSPGTRFEVRLPAARPTALS